LKAGGQKVVYLVKKDAELAVLKLVEIGSADPTALERARREFDLLARTSHPNIVQVKSHLLTLGSPITGVAWLEEYLDGSDVSDLVQSAWPLAEVLKLGTDVSAGTGALHDQGVVHRDLSAGNVRRLSDGTFRVMDPGFARHTLRSGITVGGQPGTRGFMTPEHLLSHSGPTPASDVFATGILMYLTATGVLPFPWQGDDRDYFSRLSQGARVPVLDLRPDLAPHLAITIERALHPQAARRFRNGNRLNEALAGIA
jgi:serine/threonine protein kinase